MNDGNLSVLFDTMDEARGAVADLRSEGGDVLAVSLVGPDGADVADDEHGHGSIDADGDRTVNPRHVLRGIYGGGALGALVGVALLAIPGVGPLAAAGVLTAGAIPAAMGSGAIIGAGAAGLGEVLRDQGFDAKDSSYYEEGLGKGGVLMVVDVEKSGLSTDLIDRILLRNGGHRADAALHSGDESLVASAV